MNAIGLCRGTVGGGGAGAGGRSARKLSVSKSLTQARGSVGFLGYRMCDDASATVTFR